MPKKYATESERLAAIKSKKKKSSTEIYQDFWGGPAKPPRKRRTTPILRELPTPEVIPANDPSEIDF